MSTGPTAFCMANSQKVGSASDSADRQGSIGLSEERFPTIKTFALALQQSLAYTDLRAQLMISREAAVPPPSFQRAQTRRGPALHIDALMLLPSLLVWLLNRLAVLISSVLLNVFSPICGKEIRSHKTPSWK